MAGGQSIVENIENEADPEILLNIGREHPQALGRRSEYVDSLCFRQLQEAFE